ncbi:MAG: cellulase family glycosylhydrolase [Bacteroidales bacterium]|nr:cellulase family glycosylhydrolase [Bacteroidales bacterium]
MRNKLTLFSVPLWAAVFAVSVFVGCKDDDNDGNQETPIQTETGFSVSTTTLSFPKTGGSQSFTVESSQDVLVMPTVNWIVVTKNSDGSYTVTVRLYEGTANRTGEISVLSGNNSETITVTQAFSAMQTVNIAGGESSFQTDVEKVDGCTLIIDALWIKETADGFNAAANNTDRERKGLIIYKYSTTSDTVCIVQAAGKEGVVTLSSSAMDLAAQMYPAWNLGNTMEGNGSGLNCETFWQPTKTSQKIIDYVKSLGFRAVRIPCSWYIHCDKNDNYKIKADWMSRVKEVVDYCINDGLYVELNDHWDSGWLEEFGFSSSTSSYTSVANDEEYINGKIDILKKLWTQIATEFKDYDYHLIFAGLNEPFQNYNLFNGRSEELTPILLKYNQAFVDAVRATGGNNSERCLAVQGPATNISYTLSSGFTMPVDVTENKLMVEVHYYDPYNFTLNTDAGYTTTWNSESSVKNSFSQMRKKFSDNGIPVLIGEYGANWRTVSSQDKHDASIKAFYKAINKWGPANGMIPFAWDINYCPDVRGTKGTMTIVNRAKLSIYSNVAYRGVIEGSDATVWMQ